MKIKVLIFDYDKRFTARLSKLVKDFPLPVKMEQGRHQSSELEIHLSLSDTDFISRLPNADLVIADFALINASTRAYHSLSEQLRPKLYLLASEAVDPEVLGDHISARGCGCIYKSTSASELRASMRVFLKRARARANRTPSLTQRELEILALIASGCCEKVAAVRFSRSTDTVHSHIKNIYRKLQVDSRRQAICAYENEKPSSNVRRPAQAFSYPKNTLTDYDAYFSPNVW